MNEATREVFIKECIAKGTTDKEAIRHELISHGYETEGFEVVIANAITTSQPTSEFESKSEPEAANTQEAKPVVLDNTATDQSGVISNSPVAPAQEQPQPLTGVMALVAESLKMVRSNIKVYVQGVLALGVLTIASLILFGGLFFLGSLMGSPGALNTTVVIVIATAAYLFIFAAGMVTGAALVYALVHRREGVSYGQSLLWALRHIWQLLFMMIFMQLLISGGYVFLIIPGIALSVYTAFCVLVMANEDRNWLQSLLRSTHLVYGSWWGVLWRLLASMFVVGLLASALAVSIVLIAVSSSLKLLMVLAGILSFVVLIGLIAVATSITVLLFESLQARKPAATYVSDSWKKLRIVFILLAVIGVLVNVLMNVAPFFSAENDFSTDEYMNYNDPINLNDPELDAEFRQFLEQEIQNLEVQ